MGGGGVNWLSKVDSNRRKFRFKASAIIYRRKQQTRWSFIAGVAYTGKTAYRRLYQKIVYIFANFFENLKQPQKNTQGTGGNWLITHKKNLKSKRSC